MSYTVALPDGRTVEFPDSVSPAEAESIIRRQLGIGAAAKPEGGFFPALRAGAIELGGGVSALAGKLGLKDEAAAQAEYEAAKRRAAEVFKPTEEGWTEAPFTKFKELLGGSVPYMAAPLAAGAAAATLPISGPAAAATALGAAGLTSAAQFTATNLSRQLEEGKQLADTELGSAALAAVPMALLDTLSMRMIPGIGRIFGQAGIKVTPETAKEIAEQGLKKTLIDYTAKTGKTAGIEGATEATQQVFERLQAGLSITDPEARKEYFDSFLGGAVLGGTLAPAGRFVERGREQKEAQTLLTAQAAEEKRAAREAEAAEKAKPEYALKLETDYQAAVARMKELQAAVPKKPGKDALPEEKIAYEEAKTARDKHLKEVLQPLATEYVPRKAEIAQLKERQRVEGLTPLEYQLEQTETAPIKGVKPGEAPVPVEDTEIFPTVEQPAPEVAYAQQQMDLAKQQDVGTFEATDFVDYLMQDPAMAQRLVETQTPIPGVSKKESAAILGGIKLQLTEQAKAQAKQTREATQAALQQQQADLKSQQTTETPDPLAMWKASLEETEDQATEELLRPNFEVGLTAGATPTVKTPEGIRPIQNPEQLLKRIDSLVTTRDQAAKDVDTAFAAGNKELGVKKAQEREAAQTALNNLEQTEGPGRAIVALRKAQDTALMDAAQLIDDLRVGRTLGGPEAAMASSTPQTLINQINKQRDAYITAAVQEAATTRRLYARGLTQEEATQTAKQMRDVFNEWVTRSMAQPRAAVEQERVVAPAQMRGAEVVRGAETERFDPRPLEERRFGAYRAATAVLQEQLQGLANKLKQAPREFRREEPLLKMQFPETEAAKVAEARGETAQTLEGELRRRRDYVNTQIEQAFQTRKVPGIAQTLLTRAQDFIPQAPRSFLDAAENIASRILRGQNVERSDLITMRDELRAASARPGEAEVAGERVGQRALFPAEERRSLAPGVERGSIGVIRETPERFANAPIVKRARAAAARAQELLEQIKTAWDAADVAKEKVRKKKLAKAEAAVEQQREEYRDAFNAALEKTKIAEITAKFQPQIDAVINQLALFGKARAKALRAKDKDVAKDFETIIEVERENLQNLRQQLADALKSPSKAVEPAEMRREKQMRGFTQPYEIAAAADDWVRFERDALTKAEAKLARLQGADKAPQVKAVAEQRAAVKTAEDITQRARTGLGLPGIRVERQAVAAEIAALAERIPKIKDPGKKRKAEERLARLEMTRREAPEEIKPSGEVADERAARAAEERKAEREAAAARRKEKETERSQLEDRALTLASEIEDLRDARERARIPASKERIQGQIDERSKEVMLLQSQLETPDLTRTEKRKARKAQKTLYSSRGVTSEKALLTSIAQKLQDKKPLSAYEKRIWEGRLVKRSGVSAEGKKVLAAASEAQRKEREEAQRPVGTFGETLGVEDVLSSFNVGGKDTFFSRGPTADPSTADSLRTELGKVFPDLGRVQIYDSVDALVAANPQYEGKIPSDARGFVDTAGNKAFLIAENVNKGDGLSVLLHEVGAHIGLKNALGDAQYNTLVNAVKSWEKKADGSKESQVAQAARARVEAAETTAGQVNDELLAYAIEEAVNAGVKPTETKGVLGQWLSRVAALFRKALEKFGLPPKALDAQGLVDMAFGAAKMEMRGQAAPGGAPKTRMYHGSPNAQLKELRGLTFVTPDKQTAERYAKGEVLFTGRTEGSGGRVYEVEVDTTTALDFNKPEHRVEYERARQQWNANRDSDERLPALTSPGFISSKTGYPSYGRVADILAAMPAFDSVFVDEGSQGFSLAVRDGSKLAVSGEPGEILFSRNLPTASRVANQIVGEQKGWFRSLKDNFLGMGGRAQFVDKLAPIEEALKRGGVDQTKALQAMYYLRMYDQRMHFTSQAITDGVPEIVEKARKDGETERLIETKPGANISQIVDILKRKDVVKAAGSPDAANKLFTLYLAAIRAKRVGLDALNFGKGLTQADLDAAMAEIENNDTLKDAFNEARDIYLQYNRNLVDFAVQTGALSRDEANRLLRNNDYIPYYRVRGGVAELIIGNEPPIRIGNLKDSPHLKELVGGDEPIMDFLTSSVQNTSMLLDMAMKNLATKNAMFELRDVGLAKIGKTSKKGAPEGSVTFKRDGEDYFAVVDTDTIGINGELLVKGMAGIPTMFPAFVRVFGMPARFLRRAIVASPVYMARQLFRDTVAATLTSGANITPVLGALNQIGKPDALKSRGITGGQVFTGMPEDMTRMLKEMQAGKVSVTSGLAWLEAKSAQIDALTRRNQYDSYIKQGLSEMEATYMALESMNFSKRGLSPSLHMASTLIPFFNAQIQGLDVLYKAFTGKMPMNEKLDIRQKLWTRGLLLAGASMAYALAMQDDEAYKNAKPEEKYGNWFVRLPGVDEPLRLPIPFELGYVFKALPEALVNIALNEKGAEEAAKAGAHIAKQMVPGLSSYFLPAAVKPALETILNKSIYTQRDIESAQERMVEAGYRYRDNTTQIAREIGELTGFSPIQMENLVRGYTGTMGMALLQALSFAMPSGGPEKAYKRLSEQPLIGTLFQPNDARGIIDATYERMKEVQEVQNTYKDLLKKGRPEDARKYAEDKSGELALASVAGNFRQVMGELSTYEKQVRAAPTLSPERKREILDRIRQQQIRIATSARQIFDRSKPQAVPA